MSELHEKSLSEIRGLLISQVVSVEETVRACLARIEATEPKVCALLHVARENSLAQAKDLDATGPDQTRPLWGVPLVIKDVIITKGLPTTAGSRILNNFVPFYDATAVSRLKQAGAVILAKSNLDEFSMGSSTENSAYYPTRNPWDLERVPGGSSGGSASAVSSCQSFGALGTDTGGSIRLPASFCGIVGLQPTYGRVSRHGLIAYGSSLEQIGPMTRTVEDAARVLQVIAGHDHCDSTCACTPVLDYIAAVENAKNADFNGVTIGLPEEYWASDIDSEVIESCRAAVALAESFGARIVWVSMKFLEYAVSAYYVIATAEASSNLARFDGIRYGYRDKKAANLIDMFTSSRTQGFGDEVQRRIILGTYVLSAGYYDAYYSKAAKVRTLLCKNFDVAFEKCDIIAGPVCPTTAFRLGHMVDNPLQMYLMDIFTISSNLAGLPGLSLPCGLGRYSGMPVGLQLIAPAFAEDRLLCLARALEQALPPMPKPTGLT